jgi:hypothetical protein
MEHIIESNLPKIKEIMRSHKVEKAFLFGSAAKGLLKPESDIDFLINFNPDTDLNTYADNYFNLMYALQDLLNRDVELVEENTLKNPYLLKSINQNKIQVL